MNHQLGGLVLAGGRGSRMGHVNKGLQPWFAGTLITPAVKLLQQQCAYVAISANQDLEQYAALYVDVNVYADASPWKGCGPLAGIISSVTHFPDNIQSIQILPCDTPLLSTEVITKMSIALQGSTSLAVYAQTRNQIHPVVCQFKRAALGNLAEYLKQTDKHSIRRWLMNIEANAVWFDDESQFANINDRATLDALQTQAIRKDQQ